MSSNESSQTPSTTAGETPKPNPPPPPTKHPCLLCQQRKVKCDRNQPCSNCIKSGVPRCEAAPQYPPRKRKTRFPEAELLARLRRYERHLRNYGADIDAINREGLSTEPRATNQDDENPTEDYSVLKPFSIRRSLRHVENNLWGGVNKDFREVEEILQGSSDDELYTTPLTKTYDAIEPSGDMVFGLDPAQTAALVHPTPVIIFRLWQTFLDNVNSLVKLIHAPTLQQQLLEATSDLDNVSKNLEALMFGIYSMAVLSMTDDYCIKLFNEERMTVLKRYQAGARQALQNADYLRSTDVVVLQAFVMLLLSCLQTTEDPRTLFCLTSIAVRIGQRIGLATDGTHYGLLPFEVEMRRRLWWQIVLLDTRASEVCGAGPHILTYTWNTKIPKNFNDSDLFPNMRTSPPERPGLTEMAFCRIRCEIISFFRKIGPLRMPESMAIRDKAIDNFEKHLHEAYINHCDPSIPMHFVSIILAKSSLLKFRIGFGHFQSMSDKSVNRPQAEKDRLFALVLTMVENYNLSMSSPLARNYVWHIYTNFPFPAYLYLVSTLRHKTTGELVERAWQALAEDAAHREKHRSSGNKHSVLFYALGSLTVKAWEAHVDALPNHLPTPPFISQLRQKLQARKVHNSKRRNNMSSTTEKQVDVNVLPTDQFGGQLGWLDPDLSMANQSYVQEPIFPFTDSSTPDWAMWNGMMQGVGPETVNDMDGKTPYFFA